MANDGTIMDISVPLEPGMPLWPGSRAMRLSRVSSIERGDGMNVSFLECEVHTGTHVDAPRHFLKDGATVERLPLSVLMGPARVVHFPDVAVITAKDLEAAILPGETVRLLFKTRNSLLWERGGTAFREDFVALSIDAAKWLVEHGTRLVGIDSLSIEPFRNDAFRTHHILLEAGVVIVEGLNLASVAPGTYELCCLPLKLVGAEGAPARAILRPLPCNHSLGTSAKCVPRYNGRKSKPCHAE